MAAEAMEGGATTGGATRVVCGTHFHPSTRVICHLDSLNTGDDLVLRLLTAGAINANSAASHPLLRLLEWAAAPRAHDVVKPHRRPPAREACCTKGLGQAVGWAHSIMHEWPGGDG